MANPTSNDEKVVHFSLCRARLRAPGWGVQSRLTLHSFQLMTSSEVLLCAVLLCVPGCLRLCQAIRLVLLSKYPKHVTDALNAWVIPLHPLRLKLVHGHDSGFKSFNG